MSTYPDPFTAHTRQEANEMIAAGLDQVDKKLAKERQWIRLRLTASLMMMTALIGRLSYLFVTEKHLSWPQAILIMVVVVGVISVIVMFRPVLTGGDMTEEKSYLERVKRYHAEAISRDD